MKSVQRWGVWGVCVLGLLAAGPMYAVDVFLAGQTATQYQHVRSSTTSTLSTFSDPDVNLELFASWPDRVNVHVDLHYNDRATRFQTEEDPKRALRLHTATIRLEEVFDGLGLEFGLLEIPFGTHSQVRSEGARTQNNFLIGNSMPDLGTPEPGLVAFADVDLFLFKLGYTSGSPRADVFEDRQFALSGIVWRDFTQRTTAAVSIYNADHQEGETTTDFFQPRYDNYRGFNASLVPDRAEEMSGEAVRTNAMLARQVDLYHTRSWGQVRVWAGDFDSQLDEREEKRPEAATFEGTFYSVEVMAEPLEDFYLAARWGRVEFDRWRESDEEPRVDRQQYGIGYRGFFGLLPKLEYVHQRVDEVLIEEGVIDDFQGFVGELSLEF